MTRHPSDETEYRTARLIDAARLAATVLTTTDERTLQRLAWGGRRLERLYKFVHLMLPDLGSGDVAIFMDEAYPAVLQLLAARCGDGVQGANTKLTALIDGAQKLHAAWNAVNEDSQLRSAVSEHLVGTLGIATWPSSKPEESDAASRHRHLTWISEKFETTQRIFGVFEDDLPRFVQEIQELTKALDQCTAREPAEYLCVWTIARAWIRVVGSRPSFTNNKDAVSGIQRTKFERLLKVFVPKPKIGLKIIRNVLTTIKSDGNVIGLNLDLKSRASKPVPRSVLYRPKPK